MITDFDKSFWDAYYQAEVQDAPPELARFIGQLETWTQLADPHQADQRSAAIEPLKQRLASMLADTIELDAAPHVLYRQEMVKCGKATCKRCSTGPAHGPYWYAFTTTNGKTAKKYLGKELRPLRSSGTGIYAQGLFVLFCRSEQAKGYKCQRRN